MLGFLNQIKYAREAKKLLKLYEQALQTANIYLPMKLGPGNAALASAMLNEILSDDVFKGSAMEAIRSSQPEAVKQNAQRFMLEDIPFRKFMIKILWVKSLLDKAYNRTIVANRVESSWAFQAYSDAFPPPTLEEFNILVGGFRMSTNYELGKFIETNKSKT